MKIRRITTKVNENEHIVYPFFNQKYGSLSSRLQAEFKTHGDFYSQAFSVFHEDADIASWHPTDRDFSSSCEGWKKFLKDKGRIEKEIIEEDVPITDLLFEN